MTALNRQRIADSGGDVTNLKTDPLQGLLGSNPYFLLDYGGWERSTDQQGAPYVALQLRMYRDLNYHAVGCQLYEQLPDKLWAEYAQLEAPGVLLNSAGPDRTGTLPTLKVIKREVHGAVWGVVSVPLPAQDTPDGPRIQQYVDAAADALQAAGCAHGILLCKGGPRVLYEKLRTDKRFSVVIGVSPEALAEPVGFGNIRSDGPVMLPELNWGGQEYASCHLIYAADGSRLERYNFERHLVNDDLKSPFPYRAQVADAIRERQQLVNVANAEAASK
jgi:hypothetical protein